MQRWDIINHFIKKNGYTSYLEIGVFAGWTWANVQCKEKIGTDPEIRFKPDDGFIVPQTSDDFFKFINGDKRFDIIFIDGLHLSEQVEKDIQNSLNHLSDNGVIILHDCNPPTWQHASRQPLLPEWNGDVFQAVVKFNSNSGYEFYTVDTDWGCGVIKKQQASKNIPNEIKEYLSKNELTFEYFDKHRNELLNLISIEEFLQKEKYNPAEIKLTPKKITPLIKNDNLVFVSAQPDDLVFSWQIETYVENFLRNGYGNEIHILMFLPFDRLNIGWNPRIKLLEERYKVSAPNVKFFYFEDTEEHYNLRQKINYIPLLRPFCLKQHFTNIPELKNKTIFYHDSDIVFTKHLDFNQYMKDDICYLSDTKSYLNSDYFDSMSHRVIPAKLHEFKKIDVLSNCAKLLGVTRRTCEINKNATGGAQSILKHIDADFWQDVEDGCVKLREYLFFDIGGLNSKFFTEENEGFQSWCADMWAVLWNIWKRKMVTKTPLELDFAWATDDISKWDRISIYHDAGVTGETRNKLFDKNLDPYKGKGEYSDNPQLPYNDDLSYVSSKFCSYNYVQEILEVKQKYRY